MKKLFAAIVVLIMIFCQSAVLVSAADNLAVNPSFENGDESMPSDWTTVQWRKDPQVTEFIYENTGGHEGARFVTIVNNSPNDSRFKQTVTVKENTLYMLSCWIKTENIDESTGKRGANISVEGKIDSAPSLKGTNNNWQQVFSYINTGGQQSMNVTIGLGGYGADTTGKASFDDVTVEEVSSVPEGYIVTLLGDGNPVQTSQPSGNTSSPSVGDAGTMFWYILIVVFVVAVIAAGVFRLRAGSKNKKAASDETDGTDDEEAAEADETAEKKQPPDDEIF